MTKSQNNADDAVVTALDAEGYEIEGAPGDALGVADQQSCSGLACAGPNRTGGATDAHGLRPRARRPQAAGPRKAGKTADDAVNAGSVGELTEGGGLLDDAADGGLSDSTD